MRKFIFTTFIITSSLHSLPSLKEITHGKLKVETRGNEQLIKAKDGTIAHFHHFDIGSNEKVQIQMKDEKHRIMGKILSDRPTQIDGAFSSNGRVYLINPAGIVFGAHSVVNMPALFAAAAHLSDQDFLSHIDHFQNVSGNVEVFGSIQAEQLALIGKHVIQEGTIQSNQVIYATAEHIYFGEEDGHIFVKARIDLDRERDSFIESGSPEAFLIYHGGETKAKNVHLYGEEESLAKLSGQITAEKSIVVQNEVIELQNATLSAPGGEVLIGGDVKGMGLKPSALYVGIDEESLIDVSSKNNNAGKVVLWSEKGTIFNGSIDAHGVTGGFVETSSRDKFIATVGKVNTLGEQKGGVWLLDPESITIQTGGADTPSWSDLANMPSNANVYTIDPSWIASLAMTNPTVILDATNSATSFVTLNDALDIPYISNLVINTNKFNINGPAIPPNLLLHTPGDITVNAATIVNGAITFNAGGNLTFNGTVDSSMAVNTDNVVFTAGNNVVFNDNVGPTNPINTMVLQTLTPSGAVFFPVSPKTFHGKTVVLGSNLGDTPVLLQGDTQMALDSTILFNGVVNSKVGNNYKLTINATSNIHFANDVGTTTPVDTLVLTSSSIDFGTTFSMATKEIRTLNSLTLPANTVVAIEGPVKFTSVNGSLTFNGPINSTSPTAPQDLTLNAAMNVVFNESVGLSPIKNFTIENATNVQFLAQLNPTLAIRSLLAESCVVNASGNIDVEYVLSTSGRAVPANPSVPQNGGLMSLTASGDITFYYLQNSGGTYMPVTSIPTTPSQAHLIGVKAVIDTTGGRVLSSTTPNGFSGGDVILSGANLNLLGIYAGGTPAFPGSNGVGGHGGAVSITATGTVGLKGPIFATGGAGANGGAQVLPTLVFPGQNLSQTGADSPGSIQITGAIDLGFNGIVLRGSNIQLNNVTSSPQNLLAFDSSTAGHVNTGSLTNLSYLVVDNGKGFIFNGAVTSAGVDLFNAGSDQILFKENVTDTTIVTVNNRFCVTFAQGYTSSESTSLINCCGNPPPPPPGPPSPSSSHGKKHHRFAGCYYPLTDGFLFEDFWLPEFDYWP